MIRTILLLLASATTITVFAQTVQFYSNCAPEPEFDAVFYRLDSCKLLPLERQAATMHHQIHGFLVATTKSSAEFEGSKSPVRFGAGQRLEFVVRPMGGASAADPNMIFSLRKLNSGKKTRELVTMEGHISPIGIDTKMTPGVALPVEFSKFGTSSLKMTTAELAPGEYAVGRQFPRFGFVFCFGVD